MILFLLYLLLVYVNNCRTNFYAAQFVFFSYFTNFITWYFCSPQNGTCNHLDMCTLKLSSLAFQNDNLLFYLLLVYVNNCRSKFYAAPFVFFSYFTNFKTWYFCSPQNGTCDHLDMCILKFPSLTFKDDFFLFYLLLVYVNNCRKKFYAVPFVVFFIFTFFLLFPETTKWVIVTTPSCAT